MRYGIISDIHANLEALEAQLTSLGELGAERFICLGDVVGYGASPNECVERVRAISEEVLAGNHDHAAVDLCGIDSFNPYARAAVIWTRRMLTPENMAYLRDRPFTHVFGSGLLAVHASPCSPPAWDYILGVEDARLQFDCFAERGCFVGHSHLPFVAVKDAGGGVELRGFRGPLELAASQRFIVNVGSVGQPRDGDRRASACLVDDRGPEDGILLTLVRGEYDIAAAQEKIIVAGLPAVLAHRLAGGR
jgi:diadenosine tetraphosphatase ApaH/serine/threonine PP2A family protein phosphatase